MKTQANDSMLDQATQVLRDGGIVIFPTDTAFGIGCRIDSRESVDRLFQIRKRPITQAMPVLVDSVAMALAHYDSPSDIVRRLINQHWPGALTVVAPCKKNLVYSPIRGGGDTVGLRMPNHQAILALIKGVGVPVAGPSANFHGGKTPYNQTDLDPQLCNLVDFVVAGVCQVGMASTVVDCSVDPYIILRQGSVQIS